MKVTGVVTRTATQQLCMFGAGTSSICGINTTFLLDGEPICHVHRSIANVTECRECGDDAKCYKATFYAGGNYRRANRAYKGNICIKDARHLLSIAGTHAGAKVRGWSVYDLKKIVEGS